LSAKTVTAASATSASGRTGLRPRMRPLYLD
jgi:hypothetical protein